MKTEVYVNGIKAGFKPDQLRDEQGRWTNIGPNNTDQESDEFKAWIKGSAAVKKGKPIRLYHGTPDSRELEASGIFKGRFEDSAFFFSDSYAVASSYADDTRAWDYQNSIPKVYSVFLSAKNPLRINGRGQIWRKFEAEIDGNIILGTRNMVKYAQDNGYDSLIVGNIKDSYNNTRSSAKSTVYAVFKPNQIRIIK